MIDVTGDVRPPDDRDRARFQQIDALFDAALDRAESEREPYVRSATAHDDTLFDDVMALLRAHALSDQFLSTATLGDPLAARLQAAIGQRYALRGRIGAGGMAVVFLADDLRHARPVAIKTFVSLAGTEPKDVRALERFSAEILVMARLQHSHLLPLFDSGVADGLPFYVMPFVKGETLRARLQRPGPLPLPEAVSLVRAIASGLAHAHEHGVVHRDLKPENVLLRDGVPLVADFGISMLLSASDARVTETGMIVGTPQYMSPEQAAGDRVIDQRTDIYALGAMLYEMLVGDPPHVANTPQSLFAKILVEVPTPVHVLRDVVPPAVSRVIARALAKRPADRFETAVAFDEALAAAAATPVSEPSSRATQATVGSGALLVRTPLARRWLVTTAVGVVALASLLVWRNGKRGEAENVVAARFVIAPLANAAIGRSPTLTPDGTSLVYAGSVETGRQLFVRRVNELQATALPDTRDVLSAFVSPNGEWIGYISSDDKLRRTPIGGGTSTELGGAFRFSNAAWVGNNHIVYDGLGEQGLILLSATDGATRRLTQPDTARGESGHFAPFVMPDSQTILLTIRRERSGPFSLSGELGLVTLDSAQGELRVVRLGVQIRRAVAWVDGWLLYITPDGSRVMAIRFDSRTRTVSGSSVPVLEQTDGGIDVVSVARNGTLLYTRQQTVNAPVLVDTLGQSRALFPDVTGSFMNPRLSPDGKQLSLQSTSAIGNDVVTYDLATHTPSRITTNGSALGPTWTPDGSHLVYMSSRDSRDAIWIEPTDGRAAATRLVAADGAFTALVSPDGRYLVFQRIVKGVWSIWTARLDGDRTPTPYLVAQHDVFMPELSPDGNVLAYASNETGRHEIYARPFPGPGVAVRLSQDGGVEPAWSRDGTRVYFRADRQMYVATVAWDSATNTVSARDRRVLFTDDFDGDMPMPHRNYDVHPDGSHFVMIAAAPGAALQTIVAVNWLDELRARLRVAAVR